MPAFFKKKQQQSKDGFRKVQGQNSGGRGTAKLSGLCFEKFFSYSRSELEKKNKSQNMREYVHVSESAF